MKFDTYIQFPAAKIEKQTKSKWKIISDLFENKSHFSLQIKIYQTKTIINLDSQYSVFRNIFYFVSGESCLLFIAVCCLRIFSVFRNIILNNEHLIMDLPQKIIDR